MYWLIGGSEIRKQCSIVHRFIDEAVQEALSVEHQDGRLGDVHGFLDALVQEIRDPRVLRDPPLNVMLAGRDLTACCLIWKLDVVICLVTYVVSRLLAQHLDVPAKLRVKNKFRRWRR